MRGKTVKLIRRYVNMRYAAYSAQQRSLLIDTQREIWKRLNVHERALTSRLMRTLLGEL